MNKSCNVVTATLFPYLYISPVIVFILSLIIGVQSIHAVHYKEYYKGIPDYEKISPFTIADKEIHKELRKTLLRSTASTKDCRKGSINVPGLAPYVLKSNFCNSSDYFRIKSVVKKLAPSLDEAKLTFWRTDIDGDKEPELIIGFVDLIGDKYVEDPYLSLWLLKYEDGIYKDIHAGPFLYGELHEIRNFGPDKSKKMVFIKHQSCTECEPWVYLTIVDFLKGPSGDAFSFTYSEDHKGFAHRIEYILPGMGHSADAEVETRIPTQYTDKEPHLMQHFKIKETGDEWWIFTCEGMKCDYGLFKNQLPQKYKNLWQKAKRI